MLKLPEIKAFLLVVFFLSSASGCREESFKFPYVSINANLGIISDLGDLAAGGVKVFPASRFGGVGGLVIHKDFEDQYFVYDRACTHDYTDGCYVESDTGFVEMMVCPCCSSSFLLSSEGDVFRGPAKFPLVRYQSFIDGNVLRVVN